MDLFNFYYFHFNSNLTPVLFCLETKKNQKNSRKKDALRLFFRPAHNSVNTFLQCCFVVITLCNANTFHIKYMKH